MPPLIMPTALAPYATVVSLLLLALAGCLLLIHCFVLCLPVLGR